MKHAGDKGVWLKIAKKDSGISTVTYPEALDVALCQGWIDGRKRSCDEDFFLQRFTPRRPKGLWSTTNIGHVERLIAADRMQAAGQREIAAARADGRWEAAYARAAAMTVLHELAAALTSNETARAFFDTLSKTERYSICWRVHTAKTPETRAARVQKLVGMLGCGKTIHG